MMKRLLVYLTIAMLCFCAIPLAAYGTGAVPPEDGDMEGPGARSADQVQSEQDAAENEVVAQAAEDACPSCLGFGCMYCDLIEEPEPAEGPEPIHIEVIYPDDNEIIGTGIEIGDTVLDEDDGIAAVIEGDNPDGDGTVIIIYVGDEDVPDDNLPDVIIYIDSDGDVEVEQVPPPIPFP